MAEAAAAAATAAADEAAAGPPSSNTSDQQHEQQPAFPGHYRRLQEIEKRVVHALEAASFVMTELSRERQDVDKQLLHAAATGFIQQIQEAQAMVLEAVQSAAPDREFEANNYFLMVQAMAAAEKLDAVSVHVSGISKLLRQHQPMQSLQEGPLSPDAMPLDDAPA